MKQNRVVFLTENKKLGKQVIGILQKYGYGNIETGPVGQDGLRLIRRKLPDLILFDASNKTTTSLELLKVFAEDEIAAVILILSELTPKFVEEARDSGILALLLEPISEVNLIPAVESSLINFERFKKLKTEKENLEKSLEKRKLVERAKGIVMKKYNLPEDEAYRKLQKQAMDKCISIKELSEAIILADEV